ncbi:MAG: HIT family protein [Planctomycetes bacterium]|nr:HIT family protein [Planctomycetota bacterium]
MARKEDCIFCKIVAREIPAFVLFESESGLAFLDVNPLSDGHLLLVPRDHYERLSEVPPPIAAELAEAIPCLGRALLAATKAEGFNVLLNEGAVAGQVVPHVHFHLIPRKSGDGLGYRWNAGAYQTGRAEEIAAAYKKAMPDI